MKWWCLYIVNLWKCFTGVVSISNVCNKETFLNQRCLHRVFINNETGNKSQCLSIVFLSTELTSQQCSSIKLWFLKNVRASMAKMFKIFLPLQTGEQYLNIELPTARVSNLWCLYPVSLNHDTSFGFFNHVIVIWRSFTCYTTESNEIYFWDKLGRYST